MRKPLSVETLIPEAISTPSKAALRTLLYFDIFNHPLTSAEVHHYLHHRKSSSEEIQKELRKLAQNGIVLKRENYFLLNGVADNVGRRKSGEEQSLSAIKAAQKYSGIISTFPFIRAVFISGSLSKGYMDAESDIDYFIVTAPRRLWLARTLLIVFKKVFLLNSRKNFCLNYFVASDNLEIPDRNIFTATELVSVIPTYNYSEYLNFISNNQWCNEFLPNTKRRSAEYCIRPKRRFAKSILEKSFSGRIGEWLDAFCFHLTLRFWKRKFKHFDKNDFDHRLRSRKDVSKHHPLGYQFKVLKALDEKIKLFELKHGIKL
jgi:hypothetical protein